MAYGDRRKQKSTPALILGACVLLIAGALAGCQSLENRFVFHPLPTDPRSQAPLSPIEDMELHAPDGTTIHARWYPHPQPKGALLYCSGNAGNLESRDPIARQFLSSLDRSILLFDYPGYGKSGGIPSESGCYAAANAAYEWLAHAKCVPPEKIVLCGESLGGGVAVDLASKKPHQALVLIRTFTSVPDVAQQRLSVGSAAALIVNRFDSLKKIPTCPAPIFLAQADKDRLIPFSHGEQLQAACKAPVYMYRLAGLDHNDPLPPHFFQSLRTFLDSLPAQR